jgi:hypothetical protein
VDDFNIYNSALSATQVATLASGVAGAGNVADYKFDETAGATVIDSSLVSFLVRRGDRTPARPIS